MNWPEAAVYMVGFIVTGAVLIKLIDEFGKFTREG